ncbi:MAG: hypothetical protein WC974_09195 [Thermoplasmata archaeon]
MKPQTVEEIAKELGYSRRYVREIAQQMVEKGEWVEVKVPDPNKLINAYVRKKTKSTKAQNGKTIPSKKNKMD